MNEWLNTEIVEMARKEKGVTKQHVACRLCGMSRSAGYLMLRTGLLPEDPGERSRVLKVLADFTGMEVPQILLYPQRPRKAS